MDKDMGEIERMSYGMAKISYRDEDMEQMGDFSEAVAAMPTKGLRPPSLPDDAYPSSSTCSGGAGSADNTQDDGLELTSSTEDMLEYQSDNVSEQMVAK